ncbi:MAG TPA: hypothetical protein PKC80_06055 [Burkholderiaceae bacterium]|nr:hypothetical protein [Burkholderiaceae bacterium]
MHSIVTSAFFQQQISKINPLLQKHLKGVLILAAFISLLTTCIFLVAVYRHWFEHPSFAKYWNASPVDQTASTFKRVIALRHSNTNGIDVVLVGSSGLQYALGSEEKMQTLFNEQHTTGSSGGHIALLSTWAQSDEERKLILKQLRPSQKTIVYLAISEIILGVDKQTLAKRYDDPLGFHECDSLKISVLNNQFWTCINPTLRFYVKRLPYLLKNFYLIQHNNKTAVVDLVSDQTANTVTKRYQDKLDARIATDISNIKKNANLRISALETMIQTLSTQANFKTVLLRLPLNPALLQNPEYQANLNDSQLLFDSLSKKYHIDLIDMNNGTALTADDFQGDYWHIRSDAKRADMRLLLVQDILKRVNNHEK